MNINMSDFSYPSDLEEKTEANIFNFEFCMKRTHMHQRTSVVVTVVSLGFVTINFHFC